VPPLKKNEKLMLAVIGVMIIVFIVMDPYYFIYRKPPEDTPPAAVAGKTPNGAATVAPTAAVAPTQAASTPVASAVGGAGAGGTPRIKREPMPFANWGRDPFLQIHRGAEDVTALSTLKLGGISVRGTDRYALINSQITHIGDAVGGLTVARIEKDFVLLTRGGQTYTLTWGQP